MDFLKEINPKGWGKQKRENTQNFGRAGKQMEKWYWFSIPEKVISRLQWEQ